MHTRRAIQFFLPPLPSLLSFFPFFPLWYMSKNHKGFIWNNSKKNYIWTQYQSMQIEGQTSSNNRSGDGGRFAEAFLFWKAKVLHSELIPGIMLSRDQQHSEYIY